MQHTLLGLGLLLIVAIAAALAAPAFVDWNAWRLTFETRASAIVGAPVKIRGDISATILPQPSFLLNDVEIGGPAGLRAAQVQGIVSLWTLARGVIEAEEVVLRRPSLRVAIERGGQLLLPLPAPRVEAERIAIQRIAIIGGALVVEDRISGATHVFSDIGAQGDLRTLAGPFRFEATGRLAERMFSLRLNAGRFGPDASGRLRLNFESEGTAFEAEGTLTVADAVPRFEGKAMLSVPTAGGTARIGASVRANPALVLLEGLQFVLSGAEVPIELAGQVRIEPPARRIDATLAARRIDLDRAPPGSVPRGFGPALATLGQLAALAGSLSYSGRIGVSVENLSANGGVLRDFRAEFLTRPDGFALERLEARLPGRGLLRATGSATEIALFAGEIVLEAEEPAGLVRWLTGAAAAATTDGELRLAGRLTLRLSRARVANRAAFELELRRAEGLGALALAWLGEGEGTRLVQRVADRLTPLRVAGSISDGGPGSPSVIEATARVAEVDLGLQAKFDRAAEIPLSESRLALSAREADRLAALFGLAPGLAVAGGAQLEISAAGPKDGALMVTARLAAPGSEVRAEGEIRIDKDGRIEPRLALKLDAADLRPLAAAFARAGGTRALAVSGSARLLRVDAGVALEELKLSVGDARVSGRLAWSQIAPAAISGTLGIDRAELAALVALALGPSPETPADGAWPNVAPGLALLDGMSGALEFSVERLKLVDPVPAEGARFVLKFGPAEAAIEEFSAALAGGRITGSAKFARAEMLALEGRIALAGVDLARLLIAAGAPADLGGRGDLQIFFAGNGRTPAALVASLAGQGVLAFESLAIERLDPAALAAVFAVEGPPPDETKTASLLNTMFARGPLTLARVEAPLTLAAGTLRTGTVRASAGAVQVAVQANVDLARLMLDAVVELELAPPEGLAARPGATLRWRGTMSAPERKIEAAALASAIALRAMEREMREIEKRDAKPSGVPSIMVEPPKPRTAPPSTVRAPAPPLPQPTPPDSTTVPVLPPPLDIKPPPGALAPRR